MDASSPHRNLEPSDFEMFIEKNPELFDVYSSASKKKSKVFTSANPDLKISWNSSYKQDFQNSNI